MDYKTAHESFVSGGEGSTQFHIAITILATMVPVHLRDVLYVLFPNKLPAKHSSISGHILEFLLIVIPLQLIMTVANQISLQCLLGEIFCITLLCYLYPKKNDKNKTFSDNNSTEGIQMGNKRPFITYFRAFVNMLTAFSILAVDFKIFPRYFAKAETYGTGLMDVGVGCFMISNAIVSPEARGIVSNENMVTSILKSVKSSIPLLILGSLRVIAVKSTNYQEHVTEYGVHWNFFFTLAAVKVLVTVMFCTVPRRFWNMAGVGVIALYQANRADPDQMVLAGAIDLDLHFMYSVCRSVFIRDKVSDWIKLCIHLTMITVGTWILLYCCEKYVEPVSRRFANLSYMLWMLALNCLFLLVFLIFDIVVACLHYENIDHGKQESQDASTESHEDVCYNTSTLMYAINYNGLAYFLLANILTGLVNMSVRTIYQPTLVAITILTMYMFLLNSITSYLYHKKISLKFW